VAKADQYLWFFTFSWKSPLQSWKKLHAAHTVRADIFFRIEDILVQKSRTYASIADLYGDFIYFVVNIEG
jgi:hypothetical protein